MARVIRLKDVTITNGQTISNVIDSASDYSGLAEILTIIAPAALDAATFTIEVSADGATFSTLTSDGAVALTLPGAGKAKPFFFELQSAKFWRIKSSIAVAADRVFQITVQEAN
jgi:hypothetical protein